LGSGPGEVVQGGLKVLYLWRYSQKICNPQPKNFFSSASYKTCHIFWEFDWVGSTYRTGEIPMQSHMRFVFFSRKSPKAAGCQSVKMLMCKCLCWPLHYRTCSSVKPL